MRDRRESALPGLGRTHSTSSPGNETVEIIHRVPPLLRFLSRDTNLERTSNNYLTSFCRHWITNCFASKRFVSLGGVVCVCLV